MIKKSNIIITDSFYLSAYLDFNFNGWLYLGEEKILVYKQPKDNNLALIKNKFPTYLLYSQKKFFSFFKKRKKPVFLDENTSLKDFLIIKKNLPEIKNIKPIYRPQKNDFKEIKKIFHSLEMSVIYSYSFIKENLEQSEIIYEIRDYLYLKNPFLSHISVKIDFYNQPSPELEKKLNNNNYLVYDINIQVNKVNLSFYKTIFFSFTNEDALKHFQDGVALLSKLQEEIKQEKLGEKDSCFYSKEINEWLLLIKDIFNDKNFLPFKKNKKIKFNSFYIFKLINKKYNFILFDAFYLDIFKPTQEKNNLIFLNKYSNQRLIFPW